MRNYEKICDDRELNEFMNKFNELKSQGMSTSDISRRLGIHRNTINDRIRKFKHLNNSGL